MTPPDIITRYADAFAGLAPDNMESLMATVSPDIRFVDPFNDVTGKDGFRAIRAYVRNLRRAALSHPRYRHVNGSGRTARLSALADERPRQELPHTDLASDERGPCWQGRVCCLHLDHWDSASQLLAPAGHRHDHKARAEAVPGQTGRKVGSTSPSLKPALETVARFTITPPA